MESIYFVSFISLRFDFHLPKKVYFIYFKESPLKMMKNVIHLILKALFFRRCLNFCLDIFVIKKQGLIREVWLILKFMTSQPG